MWVAFANFFCKNISVYTIFNDQSFNDTLTNNILSFEELGPDFLVKQSVYSGAVRKYNLAVYKNLILG